MNILILIIGNREFEIQFSVTKLAMFQILFWLTEMATFILSFKSPVLKIMRAKTRSAIFILSWKSRFGWHNWRISKILFWLTQIEMFENPVIAYTNGDFSKSCSCLQKWRCLKSRFRSHKSPVLKIMLAKTRSEILILSLKIPFSTT